VNDFESHLTSALAAEAAIDDPTFDLDRILAATDWTGTEQSGLAGAAVEEIRQRLRAASWRQGWLVAASLVLVAVLGLGALVSTSGDAVDVETAPADRAIETIDATTTGGDTGPSEHGTAAAPVGGCAGGSGGVPGGVVPEGAVVGDTVDVDGDGVGDRVWIGSGADGVTEVGVVTAAGGGASRVFDSASPVRRSVLVVDADGRGPVEILADDGRSVQVWAFVDCGIVDVTNVAGETYTFSLGFSEIGTGVGCVRVGGAQRLVGLHVVSDEGTVVEWSRTVVDLDGTQARNGRVETGTFTRPDDDRAIELLHQVTCGELTMTDDGIHAP
jgi:hypothetical protein